MATRFFGYTGHPLTWERTDLGRPLLKVVVALLTLLVVGFAVAYLFAALAQVAPEPMFKVDGLFGGEGPLALFMAVAFLGFIWPTNVIIIFVLALPILGLIWMAKKRGSGDGAS